MYDGERKCNMEYCSKPFLQPVHTYKGDKAAPQEQQDKPEPADFPREQHGACRQDYKETIRVPSEHKRDARNYKESETFTRNSRPKDRIIIVNGISDMFDREEEKKEYTFNFNFN